MVPRDQAVSAEIRYPLEVLKCKYSYRFGESKSKLSCSMFPDSKVTEDFSCGKTKCSYILCHGMAPFVKETVIENWWSFLIIQFYLWCVARFDAICAI